MVIKLKKQALSFQCFLATFSDTQCVKPLQKTDLETSF